mgnify:CR=1 FL=1
MPVSTESTSERLDERVGRTVGQLQRRFLDQDDSTARAELARLRMAVDEAPGRTPQVWGMVLAATPDHLVGTKDEPTRGEQTVHAALTLYAVHQQGNRRPMHVPDGRSFGTAAGILVRGRTPSTKARYDALLMAGGDRNRAYHLRSLIGLLSADGVPLDYGRLAVDLHLIGTSHREGVQRRWGRDFYRAFTAQAPPQLATDDSR